MKDKLRAKLFDTYNEKGYDYFIEVAKSILTSNLHKDDDNFRITIHGEVAEVVLEVSIDKYIKENNITDWRISKGLILKDIENKESDFSTECDITIFTPKTIATFECKSYAGNVDLKGMGMVYRNGRKYRDVWQQNQLHRSILFQNFQSAHLGLPSKSKFPNIKIAFFSMANGTLTDKRDDKWKKAMPMLTYDVLKPYLDSVRDIRRENWNMSKINRFLDIIEKNNEKRVKSHVAYVKSIHN